MVYSPHKKNFLTGQIGNYLWFSGEAIKYIAARKKPEDYIAIYFNLETMEPDHVKFFAEGKLVRSNDLTEGLYR